MMTDDKMVAEIEKYVRRSECEVRKLLSQKIGLSRDSLTDQITWALRWAGLGYMMNLGYVDMTKFVEIFQKNPDLFRGVLQALYRMTKGESIKVHRIEKRDCAISWIQHESMIWKLITLEAIGWICGDILERVPGLNQDKKSEKAMLHFLSAIEFKQASLLEHLEGINRGRFFQILQRAPRFQQMTEWKLCPGFVSNPIF